MDSYSLSMSSPRRSSKVKNTNDSVDLDDSHAFGTMPGISMHTELELLVCLGLTPREALAAATSNYSDRFAWHELGLVETGRRADLLILAADPTADITNSRKIHSVILDGLI